MTRSKLICILLLLVLGASSVGATAAQIADPPVLALVEWTGAATPDLPIYFFLRDADQRDYALVIAPLSRLQQSGARYDVLDANAARASDYVIARERRAGACADAARSFDVLYDDGRQIVVRLPFDQADALATLGFSLHRLNDAPIVLRAATPLRAPQATLPDPNVATMIAQVQASTVSDYTARISGEVPATIDGAPYTIISRRTNSGTPIQKATQYVFEQMQALGLTVSYHTWSACGLSNRNVVGEKIGWTRPDEIVLVVAHLDDLPLITNAPGADDNASGSVGVWIAAEILRQYRFERTLRFVFFTGEEQGLCGSSRYAAAVAGQNVVAVYNLDMIAWDAVNGPTLRLHTRRSSDPGYSGDLAIANMFVGVVNAYGLSSALTPIVDADGEEYSDHASFWARGFAGVLAIEDDDDDFNPNYHTTSDRLSTLNLTYFTNFVKASVGTAAHLALPLPALKPWIIFAPIILRNAP
ncbi:MAG: M28 family metallopeptidase [Anaerolineales bacterium]|nr:M28 family metallopeptidase [Anaerolineales bacterium]